MSNIHAVADLGQSLWLNYLRRALIDSGELRRMIDAGIRGITLTPSVVEKAIISSSDYDDFLDHLLAHEQRGAIPHETLLVDDVQRAADIFYPIFDQSEHTDGFVTLPLNPELAHNAISLVAEATRLGGICAVVNRTNIMIEIPATPAGIQALRVLIADGCNVRVTHIFSLKTYEEVAEAYLSGMESFLETHSVWRLTPSSLASVPVGAVDWEVDQALDLLGRPDLQGKAGVALAKVLYARSREIFGGKRWHRLAQSGAREQRLLWFDTVPKRFEYPDTFYVESLIGSNTVHALSPATLHAFHDHGVVAPTLTQGIAEAQGHLQALKDVGVDIEANWQKPQERRVREDVHTFQLLAKNVLRKRDELEDARQRLEIVAGKHEDAFGRSLSALCDEHAMCRIWEHDTSLWPSAESPVPFNWLHVLEPMQANAARLQRVVQSARADGLRQAIVLASGGALDVARMFAETFGQLPYIPGVLAYTPHPHLHLTVMDAGDSARQRMHLAKRINRNTLIVLSDKSPSKPLLPVFHELYPRVAKAVGRENAGDHFMAIADRGSALASAAQKYHFRDCFLDDPGIHNGFAALSYSGLLPAALTGAELDRLLEHAAQMACNASGCNCPLRGDNVAAQMGVALGVFASRGHHRLTFVASPFLASVALWAQTLVTDHLGTNGAHIHPVRGEPLMAPEDHDDDRTFFVMQMEGDATHAQFVQAVREAGHPLIIMHVKDPYELGGLLFTWQMAVTVAAYHLNLKRDRRAAGPYLETAP